MRKLIPFPKREPAAPQPERLELFDDIDTSGRPIFGIFVRTADGSWVDGEFTILPQSETLQFLHGRPDWSINVVEIFWARTRHNLSPSHS